MRSLPQTIIKQLGLGGEKSKFIRVLNVNNIHFYIPIQGQYIYQNVIFNASSNKFL